MPVNNPWVSLRHLGVKGASATVGDIEMVYRRRASDLFRYARARLGSREQALDAVQEGFARALRGRASYRGDGTLDAWVARCVLTASADIARARAAEPLDLELDAPAADTTDGLTVVVREAISNLPARQRDALFLRHYLDLDYASIAEVLGIEVGTVSATLHSARAALTHALQEVRR
jgi:RNA polymerase sigma-70 factor (ECF subfamily)